MSRGGHGVPRLITVNGGLGCRGASHDARGGRRVAGRSRNVIVIVVGRFLSATIGVDTENADNQDAYDEEHDAADGDHDHGPGSTHDIVFIEFPSDKN